MLNKLKNNKRAVSPLLATIVLIGFAVAIGAVIMSWGKTALQKVETPTPTEIEPDLAWYMGSNIENICYTDDGISFTLKGSPKIKIGGVFVASKGSSDYVVGDKIDFPKSETENINVKVPYDSTKYGEISQLILGAVDTSIITQNPPRCN